MSEISNEVLQPVLDEVKKLGATSKENIDELRSNYEHLKSEMKANGDKVDTLLQAKLDRLATDISVRQEQIDKAIQEGKAKEASFEKRMDELDVLLQKAGTRMDGSNPEAEQELRHFVLSFATGEETKFNRLPKRLEQFAAALPEYKRVFEKFIRSGADERLLAADEVKALSVGSEPDGGFAVTPYISSKIIERIYETSPLRGLASAESITTDTWQAMADYFDTTDSGWEGAETVAGAETDTPKMGKVSIPVFVQYARPTATQQLLEDAGFNVETWLANKVGNKLARNEGTAFITGTGVGRPRGILTYANGTTWGTVEQVAMGAAAALTADGFIKVKYALKEYYLNRGTWLMNRDAVAKAMLLKNGAGDYIWKPGMLASDPSSTLLGAPIRMAADMPVVAANALSVAYGDWAEAYQIVDRLGITVIRDPYTKKPFTEFYFRKRLGGDVINFEAFKIGVVSV